ncbi:sigma factor [Amycolatopsis sp. lyj-109]|uniref:sigma factor n=1 Tax=Amycolatopsis sp. lyj-109 TaxID=2789287 RepID=UPI00397BB6A2
MISATEFDTGRQQLFGLAYRLLGVADEANDAVEDACLRWEQADRGSTAHPEAWLTKAVTQRCLDRLGTTRATRAHHLGAWLPAPVLTTALGPLATAEQRDSVSLGLLGLLENRTPHERAVFVLRNAFGYRYRAIAEILELSPGNCRQLYHRTTQHFANRRPLCQPGRAERVRLAEQFLVAVRAGDVIGLGAILAQDVTVWADGVRRVAIAPHPVVGRDHVARYLAAAFRKIVAPVRFGFAEVNATTAILAAAEGKLLAVVAPEIDENRISGLRIVASPEKLLFVANGLSARTGRMPVFDDERGRRD